MVSQCLHKLQLLQTGEPVPVFSVRYECGQICFNSSLPSLHRTLWTKMIFLLVILNDKVKYKILW